MVYSIFLADDHTMVRDGLKRIIKEKKDYRIIGETSDGLKIIPNIKKLKPDILILDISMPNLRGIEAIRKIRRFNKKTKILVLTMHKNENFAYECLNYGAQGYILKEDADKELFAALNALLHDRLYITPTFSSDIIKMLIEQQKEPKNRSRKSSRNKLTPREKEILKLIIEGYSNKRTAHKLGISVRTVEHHRLNIMRKLNVNNTAALVRRTIQHKIID